MKSENEDKKWIDEYPTLKQVKPVNAFAVPSNYFEEMEGKVMIAIRLEELKKPGSNEGFTIPQNYFDELAQNIQSRVAIEGALANDKSFTVPENYFDGLEQNIQARVNIGEALVTERSFAVPENYFSDLEQNIQARIAIEEVLGTEQKFAVPEGYFNELEQNIQARIAIEEVVNTEQGFTVPEGYFAELESKILQQTLPTPVKVLDKKERQGVVVKMFVSRAFKYASAACFTLVVGTAIFMSEFNNPVATHNRSYLHKAVSKIPNDELELYLQLNSDDSDITTAGAIDPKTTITNPNGQNK